MVPLKCLKAHRCYCSKKKGKSFFKGLIEAALLYKHCAEILFARVSLKIEGPNKCIFWERTSRGINRKFMGKGGIEHKMRI